MENTIDHNGDVHEQVSNCYDVVSPQQGFSLKILINDRKNLTFLKQKTLKFTASSFANRRFYIFMHFIQMRTGNVGKESFLNAKIIKLSFCLQSYFFGSPRVSQILMHCGLKAIKIP